MRRVLLGGSDLRISPVALGCWQFAGDATWGEQSERDSLEAVGAALDEGINFFDNAEAYGDGRSEEVLGRALKGRRAEAVIATKTRADTAEALVEHCEASLRRLQVETIDLYQFHWPPAPGKVAPLVEALEGLRRAGKIRAFGVCNFGRRDLDGIPSTASPVANQLPYNLLWRAIEFEILPAVRARGMGVLAYSPLLQGLLTGKFSSPGEVPDGRARTRHFSARRTQTRHGEAGAEELTFQTIREIEGLCRRVGLPMHHVALGWLLHRPAVVSVIVGGRSARQVRDAARAAEVSLDPSTIEALADITETLKDRLGANPDLWQSESRIH